MFRKSLAVSFLPSGVCIIVYSLCAYSSHCPLGHGPSHTTCCWCYCMLVALDRFLPILRLSALANSTGLLVSRVYSSWDTFTHTFPELFSRYYFSIHIHRIHMESTCTEGAFVIRWGKWNPFSKTPATSTSWLWFLHCRNTLYQNLWNPAPSNSQQCPVKS